MTAIDLFAGAGGATQGLRDAGFDVVGAVEIDEDACESYRLNHPGVKIEPEDILDLVPAKVRRRWSLRRGELTLLKACPPCQGFSTLGSSNPDDPRNDLLSEVWEWIDAFDPKAFLLENVPGIRSDDRLAALVGSAKGAGYQVRAYTIDAADFGVPQRRRRHIVVGVKRSSELPDDLSGLLGEAFDLSPQTAGEALRAADSLVDDSLDIARTLRPKTLERVHAVPVGGSRFDLPKKLQLACHKRLDGKKKARNAAGPYGRVKADKPAPTMTTRCTTVACGSFIHPTKDRGLTLREAALLQTFPPQYQFSGGYDSIERQVGNAVPVRLAEALGLAVKGLVSEPAQDQVTKLGG